MKKKIELVCWILFTVFSGIGFFINFMSKPPVNDTHTFTLYMIGAAVVSLLYPASMFVLGLRNRYLYDKLNELAEEKGETEAAKSAHTFRSSASGYTVPDMDILVSALTSDQKLTEEEKEPLARLRWSGIIMLLYKQQQIKIINKRRKKDVRTFKICKH